MNVHIPIVIIGEILISSQNNNNNPMFWHLYKCHPQGIREIESIITSFPSHTGLFSNTYSIFEQSLPKEFTDSLNSQCKFRLVDIYRKSWLHLGGGGFCLPIETQVPPLENLQIEILQIYTYTVTENKLIIHTTILRPSLFQLLSHCQIRCQGTLYEFALDLRD